MPKQPETQDTVADSNLIPYGLRQLVQHELEAAEARSRHSGSWRAILTRCAVIGPVVSCDVLEAALELEGDASLLADLDPVLDALVTEGILANASPDGETLRFRAGLHREIALEMGGRKRKLRRLHGYVAGALETVFAGRDAPVAGRIADHYEQAGRIDEATTHVLHAARVARAGWNLMEAHERFEQALRLAGASDWADEPRRRQAALGLVEVCLARDRSEQARSTLTPLLEWAESAGEADTLARGAQALATLSLRAGDYEAGLSHARRAVAHAERAGAEELARDCRMVEGRLLEHLRRYDEARGVYEPLLAQLGDAASSPRAHCQFRIASLELRDGNYAQARTLLAESVRTHEATGDRLEVARCLHNQALVELLTGHLDEALSRIESAISEAIEIGSGWLVENCQRLRGDILTRLGDTDTAMTAYDSAIDIAECSGHRDGLLHALNNRAWSLLYAGRTAPGRATAQRGLDLARDTDHEAMIISCELALGEAQRQEGDVERAVERLREHLDRARAAGLTLAAVTDGLAAIGRACVALDRRDEARAALTEAADIMARQGRDDEARTLRDLAASSEK